MLAGSGEGRHLVLEDADHLVGIAVDADKVEVDPELVLLGFLIRMSIVFCGVVCLSSGGERGSNRGGSGWLEEKIICF